MKKYIKSYSEFTEWGFPRDWNENDDLTQEEANVFNEYLYWFREAKQKGIDIENLYEYLVSRTYDNEKSSLYRKEYCINQLDLIAPVLNECNSTEDAYKLAYYAHKDYDKARKWFK